MDAEDSKKRSAAVAAVFDKVAGSYDAVGVPWFTPIAERLVRELVPAPGERALDIGCGRGAALFPLASAVGPSGHVTGIDLAEAMIAATSADVEHRGFDWVDLQVMDAGAPDLPAGSFDVVTASLVAFFLPDPLSALRSWYELLAPGGRMGITTFGASDDRWESIEGVFRPYLPPNMLDARTSGVGGHFADDDSVNRLVGAAGLRNVRSFVEELTTTFVDADQWRTWSQSHGQRAMWDAVPQGEMDTVIARLNQRLADLAASDGSIQLSQQVRYTVGQKG